MLQSSINLEEAVRQMAPAIEADSRLLQARRVMGSTVGEMSDADLGVHLTGFAQLVDGWLDEYERQRFDGSTFKEYLGG
jgi:hypothetical protein